MFDFRDGPFQVSETTDLLYNGAKCFTPPFHLPIFIMTYDYCLSA